jgi:hypothetical protein
VALLQVLPVNQQSRQASFSFGKFYESFRVRLAYQQKFCTVVREISNSIAKSILVAKLALLCLLLIPSGDAFSDRSVIDHI